MVCVEQHWRQGNPATRGRLFERHLFLQRRGQQKVLLKGIHTAPPELPVTASVDQARSNADVHDQDSLLVTDAGLVTVIIGVATRLILI
jgi:hypothetical protein